MKTLFSISTLFAIFFSPTIYAKVFWDDEMESGNTGYAIVGGAMSYDTTEKMSGNGSVRLNYPSSCYPDASAQVNCGGYMDRAFQATEKLFRRFYIKLSAGFIISDVFTKIMRSDTSGPNSNWWVLGCCGKNEFLVSAQNVPTIMSATNFGTSAKLQSNRWYCIETYEHLNSPGDANGISQAWVDGIQVMNQSGIKYRQTGDTSLFNNNRLYRQTGSGYIWYDRVAVGDSRIGCSGTPPAEPPPIMPPPAPAKPRSPTGLQVR